MIKASFRLDRNLAVFTVLVDLDRRREGGGDGDWTGNCVPGWLAGGFNDFSFFVANSTIQAGPSHDLIL